MSVATAPLELKEDLSKYTELLARIPKLLNETEHALPHQAKIELVKQRVTHHTMRAKAQAAKAAELASQQQQQGQQGQQNHQQPLQPPQTLQHNQQQHQMQQQQLLQQQMQRNGSQAPMQHSVAQGQGQQGHPGAQGQGDGNQVYQQQQQQQQLYQQQQQQQGQINSAQQQQQNTKALVEAQNRQRQAAAQQQQQHMGQQHIQGQSQLHAISAIPSNLAPSPQQQQQQLMGSPQMNRANGRSPSQGPGQVPQRNMPTPAPGNTQLPMQGQQQQQQSFGPTSGARALFDNFDMLYAMKLQGKLLPEQEKLLVASPEGRAHLEQLKSKSASAVANQVGQVPHGQPLSHSQLAQAAQQQLLPLQQQQALQRAQMQNGHPQSQQFVNGNMNPVQYQQQIQMQAMAQAQANLRGQAQQSLGNLAQLQQQQQLQQQHQQQQQLQHQQQNPMQQQMTAQAQQMARTQQAQQTLMHAQAMQAQQAQAQVLREQQQLQHAEANGYAASPRPGGGQQMVPQNTGQPANAQQVKQTQTAHQLHNMVQRVSTMSEQDREHFFNRIRPVYFQLMQNPQGLMNLQNFNNHMNQNNQAAAGANSANNAQTAGAQFAANQSRVSANLHIPANKQRNLLPNQAAAAPAAVGSPRSNVQGMGTPQAQQAALRMVNAGYPVQNGGPSRIPAPGAPGFSVQPGMQPGMQQPPMPMDPKIMRPEMLIAQMDPNLRRQRAASSGPRRDSEMHPSGNYAHLMDHKGESILAQAKWVPDAAYDQALMSKLSEFHPPVKQQGRATLTQGFPQGRVLSDVMLERVPEAIRAIAEDAESESMALKKKEVDPTLPSQKKRKLQEVADMVDKGLKIDGDVETLLLKIGDEHLRIMSQVSCNLAKHRKGETVERKDVQLAYETILGRSFPGFSSDLIRMDQSKISKRPPVNALRANKLRLVQESKAAWRREKIEAEAAKQKAAISGGVETVDNVAAIA